MSTPIKPPGGAPAPATSGQVDETARVDGKPGELGALVDDARSSESHGPASAQDVAPTSPAGIHSDLAAGRIDAQEAIERLVHRAMAKARALPAGHRAALESQLRAALAEDPTLIALQKDLARGSRT